MDDLSKVKTNLEDSKKEWQIHIDQTKASFKSASLVAVTLNCKLLPPPELE
jgi:hypothetical protein